MSQPVDTLIKTTDWVQQVNPRIFRIFETLIGLTEEIADNPQHDIKGFIRDTKLDAIFAAMDADDLRFLRSFKKFMGENRRALTPQSLEMWKAINEADPQTRAEVLLRLKGGTTLLPRHVEEIAKSLPLSKRTAAERTAHKTAAAFEDAAQEAFQARYATLKERAKSLRDALKAFQDSLPPKTKHLPTIGPISASLAENIKQLASSIKEDFEQIFQAYDWTRVDDPTLVNLGNVHEALTVLSTNLHGGKISVPFSNYRVWPSVEAIGLLVGEAEGARDQRLTSIELFAGSGGRALAFETVGFQILGLFDKDGDAISTINANKPGWRAVELNLSGASAIKQLKAFINARKPASPPLDLLTGALPSANWTPQAKNKRQANKSFVETTQKFVAALGPKAFLFDINKNFLLDVNLSQRQKLIGKYERLGYRTQIIPIKDDDYFLTDRSVNKKRFPDRAIIIGLKRELWANLGPLIPTQPVRTTLRQAIADLAFPDYMKFLETRKKGERFPGGSKGGKEWLQNYGKKLIPDVTAVEKTTSFKMWEQYGFRRGSEGSSAKDDAGKMLLPKNIDYLKRLKGFPDKWQIHGKKDSKKRALIFRTPPLQVSLVLAKAIHTALSGQYADPSKTDLLKWSPPSIKPHKTETDPAQLEFDG